MRRRVLALVLANALLFGFFAERLAAETLSEVSDSYWRRFREGWFWYDEATEDQKPQPQPMTEAVEKQTSVPIPAKPRELAEHEALVKQVEDLRNIAFMNPTDHNMKAYLDLQTKVVQRASHFADVWQRVVWANPYMDFTVQGRPANAAALEVYDRQKEHSTSRLLAELAKTHVLFFFFRSDCPYCHRFAPLLRNFEAKYGLKIFPVSLDGGALPEFPHPSQDNGISNTLNVKMVPTLFLASPSKAEIIPLGAGLMSETELLERISIVVKPLDSQPALAATTVRP